MIILKQKSQFLFYNLENIMRQLNYRLLVSIIRSLIYNNTVVYLQLPQNVLISLVYIDHIDLTLDYLIHLIFCQHISPVDLDRSVIQSRQHMHDNIVIYITFLYYLHHLMISTQKILNSKDNITGELKWLTTKIKNLPYQ